MSAGTPLCGPVCWHHEIPRLYLQAELLEDASHLVLRRLTLCRILLASTSSLAPLVRWWGRVRECGRCGGALALCGRCRQCGRRGRWWCGWRSRQRRIREIYLTYLLTFTTDSSIRKTKVNAEGGCTGLIDRSTSCGLCLVGRSMPTLTQLSALRLLALPPPQHPRSASLVSQHFIVPVNVHCAVGTVCCCGCGYGFCCGVAAAAAWCLLRCNCR